MIHKAFDAIEEDDIRMLVENEVPESRYLDYKRELPDWRDKEKKREFLADVASFANASGGHLIYGVSENRDETGESTALPGEIVGLPGFDPDADVRTIEQIILSHIEPRIPGLHLKALTGFDKPVLIIHIPKSIVAPHLVTLQWRSHFHSRRSKGKHPMDLAEIRDSFALSADFGERIRAFRDDRVSRICRQETEVKLGTGPKLALHLFPVASLDPRTFFDVASDKNDYQLLAPFSVRTGYTPRLNFEGYLIYDRELGVNGGYVQFFRNGIIESVSRYIFTNDKVKIHGTYERKVVTATDRYLAFYRHIGIQPPVYLMLSFLNVKGCEMFANPEQYTLNPPEPMPRDTLPLQAVLIEDLTDDAAKVLRPAFYHAWQAAGYPKSPNYDDNDNWKL